MAEKKKWSKGQMILTVCILGALDTGFAWFLHYKAWVAIDFIFWPIIFIGVLSGKEDSN